MRWKYRNSGNFHCHVIFVAVLKMHFYIRFRYKKLKLITMKLQIQKKILNENFLNYGNIE